MSENTKYSLAFLFGILFLFTFIFAVTLAEDTNAGQAVAVAEDSNAKQEVSEKEEVPEKEEPALNSPYIEGEDGHLFLNTGDGTGEEDYIDLYSEFVAEINTYCKKRGIDFLFELDPGKATVYPNLYTYDDKDRLSRNQYILSAMKEKGVPYVYTHQALADNGFSFGKRYDTGHWSFSGAYAAIAEVVTTLRNTHPLIGEPSTDNYISSLSFHSSFYPTEELFIEEETVYTLKEDISEIYRGNPMAFGDRPYFHHVNPAMSSAPSVLIFGGSYMEGKHRLFAPYFSEVIYIKSYFNFINYEYYISLFRPDIVILETADYVMYDSFGSRKDMAAKRHIPLYSDIANIPYEDFSVPVSVMQQQSGAISHISTCVPTTDASAAYIISGDIAYDCTMEIRDGSVFAKAAVMTEAINRDHTYLAVLSSDGNMVRKAKLW